MAIETTDEDAHVDWRANYDALTYRRIATPPAVQAGIARCLGRLDLRFAALDFAVDHDDSWFLEANRVLRDPPLEHPTDLCRSRSGFLNRYDALPSRRSIRNTTLSSSGPS